jgi:hypothetical protein
VDTLFVLGHVLSQGNPWIPLMVVGGIAVVVVFALVAAGRLTVEDPGDLLLPGATIVLVAGLAGSLATADWLLDQGPWLVPAAVVLLVGLVAASVSDRVTLGPGHRRTSGAVVAIAIVAGVAAFGPLDEAWFGQEDTVFAVEPIDARATIELVAPPDDEGRFVVEVTVADGTIGDNEVRSTRPSDPEQEMFVRFLVNGQPRIPTVPEECAADPGCTTAQFELFHVADEPLERVTVEFLTADLVAFSSPISATLVGAELTAP